MTVEELKVIISAETKGFDKASKNTKKTVTKMDKTINSLHKKLQNAFNIRENNNNTLNKLSSQFEKMQKRAHLRRDTLLLYQRNGILTRFFHGIACYFSPINSNHPHCLP